MINRMMTKSVIDALSETLNYHNYVFFSKTTVTWNDKEHTVSYGILGKVITLNKDDITQALKKKKTKILNLQDENGMMDRQDADREDETDILTDTDSDIPADQFSKKAKNKIVNSISDMVKKKVAEETDSATEKGLGKIIDEILNLFR